jgi:hypothetical protein
VTDLWSLLPAVYRVRDAAQGDPLRALLAVIQREVTRVEDDINRLYDNWFIETCDEWVVPYIADLLGVKGLVPVKAPGFSQRAAVANTLAYRRRKGTVAVLEQLARDLTGYPAKAVEFFERLGTTQHVNHVRLGRPATLDVRSAYALQLIGTPFEGAARTGEARHIDVGRGYYGVPNVGLFLWRLSSYLLTGVTASAIDARRYTFDPGGDDRALFNVPQTGADIASAAAPVNVPMPITRLTFARDLPLYYGAADAVKSVLVTDDAGVVARARVVACDLSDSGPGGWAHEAPPGRIAVDPELGRIVFADPPAGEVVVSFACGFGGDLGGGPYDRRDAVAQALSGGASWQMGVMRAPPAGQADVVATLGEAVTAWNALPPGSRGVIALMDSRTYEEDLDSDVTRIRVPQGSQLLIVAGDWPEETQDDPLHPVVKRPGMVSPVGVRPMLKGTIEVVGTAPSGAAAPGALIVNGALIQGTLTVRAGNLGRLELAHCTLAPGATAFSVEPNEDLRLAMTRCVSGDLSPAQAARSLRLMDCIVDGRVDGRDVEVESTTVLGETAAQTLHASNSILVGTVAVERRQVGCVRFSYLPFASLAPRRFRCQPLDLVSAARVAPQFTSVTYGDPGYAGLATACPTEISTGAEDEGEMGAWHFVASPQRVRNLRQALDEYLRFGLEAGIFFVPQPPNARRRVLAALPPLPRPGAPVPEGPAPDAPPTSRPPRRPSSASSHPRRGEAPARTTRRGKGRPTRRGSPARKRPAKRSPGRRQGR